MKAATRETRITGADTMNQYHPFAECLALKRFLALIALAVATSVHAADTLGYRVRSSAA